MLFGLAYRMSDLLHLLLWRGAVKRVVVVVAEEYHERVEGLIADGWRVFNLWKGVSRWVR